MNLAIRKKYNFYWRFYLDRRDEESCGNRFLVASGVNDIKAGRRKVFKAGRRKGLSCDHRNRQLDGLLTHKIRRTERQLD